jgi:hypothetical protein
MRNLIFVLLLFISVILGCKKDNQPADSIQISIQNNSPFTFTDVLVRAPEGENNYGSINSYKKSNYKEFQKAYRYSYISLKIGNEELGFQPFDYFGETELEKGRHTYVLSVEVVNNNKRLKLAYRKD